MGNLVITSFCYYVIIKNKCYYVILFECVEPARIRGNRGEGKTPETYGGRKFIASNPRGVHAVRQVHAPCVEMPVNRGSITTY